MPLDPRSVVILSDSGVSVNMGDVTNTTSPARFSLPTAFGLAWIRGLFTDGSSQADLTIRIDNPLGTRHDYTLRTLKNLGTGDDANLFFRIGDNELAHWVFSDGSVLVLEWTNPNTQAWGIEVGLYPI